MPDELKSGETPQGGEQDNGGQAPQGDGQGGTDVSAAEVERLRAALKAANAEAAERRVKLKELEEAETKRREAEMSEVEKAQKQAQEMKAEAERLQGELRNTQIRHAVEVAAVGMQFHAPADALSLADLSQVQIGDDGTVTGVEDALKALVKARPYLVKPSTPAGSDINAGSRGRQRAPSNDELVARKRASGAYVPL